MENLSLLKNQQKCNDLDQKWDFNRLGDGEPTALERAEIDYGIRTSVGLKF